ncbi:MAG: CHAP domain-containing protein [Alphaproteobacteria bacterium]|nr:CHAP domain-containing protein [Alphaproteobacteria bacterium]
MVGSFIRLAAAATLCAALAGCATPSYETSLPEEHDAGGAVVRPESPLQCVPYARARSHIAIYGDAYTWWDQAAGRFERSSTPRTGSVMVLHDYAGPDRAHLAFVRAVVDSREIRVDHANWLDDGAIYSDDPVRDVSPDNDWSEVRVFNLKTAAWGARVYPVQGFIGPDPDASAKIASGAPSPSQRDGIADLLAADPDFGATDH